MKVFNIGFTKKSAEAFFSKLRALGAKRLVDMRLNNVSQLAGFAKRDDLEFFRLTHARGTRATCGMCLIDLAPVPGCAAGPPAPRSPPASRSSSAIPRGSVLSMIRLGELSVDWPPVRRAAFVRSGAT